MADSQAESGGAAPALIICIYTTRSKMFVGILLRRQPLGFARPESNGITCDGLRLFQGTFPAAVYSGTAFTIAGWNIHVCDGTAMLTRRLRIKALTTKRNNLYANTKWSVRFESY